jgi:hypothetical protein
MKRKCYLAVALRGFVALSTMGGFAGAQTTVDGSMGVDMGNTGYISGLQPLLFADGVIWDWETLPDLQSLVLPAGQLTGLAPDGSAVHYDDLIPLKVPKLTVVIGSPGAAPDGAGTIIDGEGIGTNQLVVEGPTHLNGKVFIEAQGDISMGIYQ